MRLHAVRGVCHAGHCAQPHCIVRRSCTSTRKARFPHTQTAQTGCVLFWLQERVLGRTVPFIERRSAVAVSPNKVHAERSAEPQVHKPVELPAIEPLQFGRSLAVWSLLCAVQLGPVRADGCLRRTICCMCVAVWDRQEAGGHRLWLRIGDTRRADRLLASPTASHILVACQLYNQQRRAVLIQG